MAKSSSSRSFRNNGRMKAGIKSLRTQERIDKATSPKKHEAMANGFNKIVNFFDRAGIQIA